MSGNSILLINDMAGYGKVALSSMIPILSSMKFQVYNLPTALVSNTLDYGKFDILETTDYMKNSMKIWEELGFHFDMISTGFLVSAEQTKLVCEYCRKKKEEGTFIFVDPIMGDDGTLYNGVTEHTVHYMREMCKVADLIVPNYTEAAFLAGKYTEKTDLTQSEAEDLVKILHENGAKTVVITSMKIEGQSCTLILDGVTNEITSLPYTEIPVRFAGTGDIFSAVLIGKIQRGQSLKESVQCAMDAVKKLIEQNKDNADKYKGIPIEQYLEELAK